MNCFGGTVIRRQCFVNNIENIYCSSKYTDSRIGRSTTEQRVYIIENNRKLVL